MTIRPIAASSHNARYSQLSQPVAFRGSEKLWTYMRWLAIGVWCALRVFDQSLWRAEVAVLAILSLIYCGLLHWRAAQGRPLSYTVTLFTDPLLVTLLCSVSGGFSSSAFPYFYGTIIAFAARFGLSTGMLTAGISALFSVALFFLVPTTASSSGPLAISILYFVLLPLLSGPFTREGSPPLTQSLERDTLDNRLLALSRSLLAPDLDTVLQQLADELHRQIPCRGVGVLLLEPHRRRTDRVAAAGELEIPSAQELNAALTNGLLHDALEQGTVMLDAHSFIRTRFPSSPRMQEWASKNILIIRLLKEEPLGCLILTDKRGVGGFTHEEVQLLTITAEHAALTLLRAREAEQLQGTEGEQRELLRAVIQAQDEERKRVVEEWHARIGEKLFQVIRDFRACQELITQRVPEGKERVNHLAGELDAIAALVRHFTNEIHPSLLEDFGFVEALREYVSTLRNQEPFVVTLQAHETSPPIPVEAGLTLFRITQEAVRNIRQHAQAKNVQIAFVQELAGVSLMIKDDGQGFNPTQPQHGHYGLLYMRERAEACGGEFHIRSSQGQGTEIRVEFPIASL